MGGFLAALSVLARFIYLCISWLHNLALLDLIAMQLQFNSKLQSFVYLFLVSILI